MRKLVVAAIFLSVAFAGFFLVARSAPDPEKIKSRCLILEDLAAQLRLSQEQYATMKKEVSRAQAELARNDFPAAEKILDQTIAVYQSRVAGVRRTSGGIPILPPDHTPVQTEDSFSVPEPVSVTGYRDDLMEPLISKDGRFLLFNNSNSPETDTHIHIARRQGPLSFAYLGKLPGALSQSKDYAPAMTASGRMFFTSLRLRPRLLDTLLVGDFKNGRLSGATRVPGTISSHLPLWLNMDCEVSADGSILIISRARFSPGGHVPRESDLIVAELAEGRYRISSGSRKIMAEVNSSALEYAPCLSSDGLELFFTRAGEAMVKGRSQGNRLAILRCRRGSVDAPFEAPRRIASITGFVEGPTLSADGRELFFHKRDEEKFRIYRCLRR